MSYLPNMTKKEVSNRPANAALSVRDSKKRHASWRLQHFQESLLQIRSQGLGVPDSRCKDWSHELA